MRGLAARDVRLVSPFTSSSRPACCCRVLRPHTARHRLVHRSPHIPRAQDNDSGLGAVTGGFSEPSGPAAALEFAGMAEAPVAASSQGVAARSLEEEARSAMEAEEDPPRYLPGMVLDMENAEPDVEDPNWPGRVTDWYDYWTYARWDEAVEELDDESVQLGTEGTALRFLQMVDTLNNYEKQEEVVRFMGIPNNVVPHRTVYDDKEPEPGLAAGLYDNLTACDVRAIADKRHRKALLDAEWEEEKQRLDKFNLQVPPLEIWNDYRCLTRIPERAITDFSHQEVWDLITNHGHFADPHKHPCKVINPRVYTDYVNDHGVRYIEETEDFLQRIGHLADDDFMRERDQQPVVEMQADDFADFSQVAEFVEEFHRSENDEDEFEDLAPTNFT